VPLGALAAVAVRYVPAAMAPGRRPGVPLRPARLILLAAGLTGPAAGCQPGRLGGLDGPRHLAAAGRGAALTACYAGWAARREPAGPRPVAGPAAGPALSMALCALASVVTWAAVFLLPVFVHPCRAAARWWRAWPWRRRG
jgi:hypothetical protein